MNLAPIKFGTGSFSAEKPGKTQSEKQDFVFENILEALRTGVSGGFLSFSPQFLEKFSGKDTDRKIAEIHDHSSKTLASQNSSSNVSEKTENVPRPALKDQEIDFSKFKLMEKVQLFFNFEPAAGIVNPAVLASIAQPTLADEINLVINQILNQIKVMKNGEQTKLDLFFKREQLGQLKVSLSFENGRLDIQLVLNEEARNLLEPHFSALIERLKHLGIEVGALNVAVRDNYEGSRFSDNLKDKENGLAFESSDKRKAFKPQTDSSLAPKFLATWRNFWAREHNSNLVETLV